MFFLNVCIIVSRTRLAHLRRRAHRHPKGLTSARSFRGSVSWSPNSITTTFTKTFPRKVSVKFRWKSATQITKVADTNHEVSDFQPSGHVEMVATKSVTIPRQTRLCRSNGIWERAQHDTTNGVRHADQSRVSLLWRHCLRSRGRLDEQQTCWFFVVVLSYTCRNQTNISVLKCPGVLKIV